MTDFSTESWLLAPLIGVVSGVVLSWSGLTPGNAIVRMGRGDARLMWGLAMMGAVGICGVQALQGLGMLTAETSRHAEPILHWTGMMGGSFLFGVGLALARMDLLSAVLLMGRGNMAAITVFFITVVVAMASTNGLLLGLVNMIQGQAVADLRTSGVESLTVSGITQVTSGVDVATTSLSLAGAVGGAMCLLILLVGRVWKTPFVLLAAIVGGGALPALWALGDGPNPLPWLLHEPAHLTNAIMGGGSMTPTSLVLIGLIVGGGCMAWVKTVHDFPTPPSAWRLILGSIAMAFGGVLAGGDIASHGAVGLPSMAIPSLVILPIMVIAATTTSRMLDG